MNPRLRSWLENHSLAILLGFAVITVLAILPHISWGLPAEWHPDEIANDVRKALEGKQPLLDNNYDYPMLPKIFLYAVGKIVFHFGYDASTYFRVVRFFSAVLAAAILFITYQITRAAGGNKISGLFASLLCLSSSEIFLHAHFAHNDLYLVFFASLSIYALLRYQTQHSRAWFFLACFLGGLAIASKYNGIGLTLAIAVVFFYTEKSDPPQQPIQVLKTLFIGGGICLLAYLLSNPTAALHPLTYLHDLLPALRHHSIYARTPSSPIGALGEWQVMINALGLPAFLMLTGSALYGVSQLILTKPVHTRTDSSYTRSAYILLVCLIALDLPILFSYNLQARFILPLLPPAFALTALSIEDIYTRLASIQPNWNWLLMLFLLVTIVWSGLRVISVFLLFQNDARIAAGQYLQGLPHRASIETTLYPPTLDHNIFRKVRLYPIFFPKYPGHQPPETKVIFNQGEAGIEQRAPQYLVVDSFTYQRFDNPYICQTVALECAFFQRLSQGETHYQLVATFQYTLPRFLPQVSAEFVNPTIKVYQRKR